MSLVSVEELMSDAEFLYPGGITLRRPSVVQLANEGENVQSWEPDVNIAAIVQPATAEEIAALPEGSRGSGAVKRVWSATALRMGDGETFEADVLVIGGASFKVVGEQEWDGHGYRFVLASEFLP